MLRRPDEFVGRQQPMARVQPAHQRLGAENAPAFDSHHRLEMEQQLVVLDGVAQFRHQRQALRVVGVVFRGIHHIATARFLGAVHGHIRLLHQVVGVVGVRGGERHADARFDRDRYAGDDDRLIQHGQDFFYRRW